MIQYRTLNLRLQELRDDLYEVTVQGPDGDGRAQFELSFGRPDLDAVAAAVSRPRTARRRIESDESSLARAFGNQLFDLVFLGTTRDVLRASLSHAHREDQGLRLMFQLEGAPRLRNVPWELLWDRPKFLSTSAYTPVLRYVDLPMRPQPLRLSPPLRILGVVSSPGDMPALDAEDEQAQLADACRPLSDEGLLEIEWVADATLRSLLEALNQGTYHVFHFHGHGDFDETADDGVLLFEGRAGRSHRVTGTELATILADHHALRLGVINACEGARVAEDWGGIAASLMQYGLPAVIAMQFEISDAGAISFARCFYASLARGCPIDEALGDARRGMFADGYGLEWATPVQFTSIDDGRLFDLRWEEARPTGARVALTLELDPVTGQAGTEVTWRLGIDNVGTLDLRELRPMAEDSRLLAEPISLASGQQQTMSWVADVEPGDEAVVIVSGVDSDGQVVQERISARAPLDDGLPARRAEPIRKLGGDRSESPAAARDRLGAADVNDRAPPPPGPPRAPDAPVQSDVKDSDRRAGQGGERSKPRVPRRLVASGAVGVVIIAVALAAAGVFSGSSGPGEEAIEVGGAPVGIALASGSVWVAHFHSGNVTRIDASTRRPDPRGISTGREPVAVATSEDHQSEVWVANKGAESVVLINAEKHAVDDRKRLTFSPNTLAVGYAVDVADPVSEKVWGISRATRELGKDGTPVGSAPRGIAAAGGTTWVTGKDGTLRTVDEHGRSTGPLLEGLNHPAGVAVAKSGMVWIAVEGANSVVGFNPTTKERTKPIPVGLEPKGIAAFKGKVWVTNFGEEKVSEIQESERKVLRTIPVGKWPNSVVAGKSGIWVANLGGKTVSWIPLPKP
jgi:DNA-binding beta-propeller fold protein YncE/CHAT domain-containing protein